MKEVRNLGPFLYMGWVVALATLIPLGFGVWLDRRFGTAPLFILIGALVGIFAATVGAVRIASRTIEALGTLPEVEASVEEEEREKEDTAQ